MPRHEVPQASRFLWRTALVAVTVVGAVLAFFTIRFTIDDAFITFRYGQTLVEHGVWNWDAGLPPVEAYTNPIYAFLSVVPAALGIGTEFFFKLFSAAILVLLLIWLWRQRSVHPWLRLLATALVVANPTFQLHLWSGLETPLFVALLTVVFVSVSTGRPLSGIMTVLCLLLVLTRPEGVGFALVAAGWSYLVRPERVRAIRLTVVVVFIVGYWVVRAAYFGRLFPNTFYVKSGADGTWATLIALSWVVLSVGALIIIVGLGLRLFARDHDTLAPNLTSGSIRRWWAKGDRAACSPVVFAVAAAGVALVLNRTSDLLMNYANRFEWQLVMPVALIIMLTPHIRPRVAATAALITVLTAATNLARLEIPVVLALLIVAGLSAFAVWVTNRRNAVAVAAGLCGLTLAVPASYQSSGDFLTLVNYRPRLEASHVALGQALQDSETNRRVLAVGDAGVIPFYSGWTAYDEYGLANPYITDGEFTEEFLNEHPPSVIFINAGNSAEPTSIHMDLPGEVQVANRFAQDPENGYEFLAGPRFRSNYRMHVYLHSSVDGATRDQILALMEHTDRVNRRSEMAYFTHNWHTTPFLEHLVE